MWNSFSTYMGTGSMRKGQMQILKPRADTCTGRKETKETTCSQSDFSSMDAVYATDILYYVSTTSGMLALPK